MNRKMTVKTVHSFIWNFSIGFIWTVIFGSGTAYAQDIQQKLKSAQELQRLGRLDEARGLYEELHQRYPENGVVFDGLKDLYLQTRGYDRAMAIIQARLLKFPDDISLEIAAGQVLHRMGREKEALQTWKEILNKKSKEMPIYQLVANAMVGERLFDEAIDVYLFGRKQIGRDDLFVFNLASLYGARMHFEKAAEELIRFLRSNPQHVSTVETQFRQYPKTERVIRDITRQLEKAIESDPQQPAFPQLLASVYLNAGQYDEAFQVILILEQMIEAKKQGQMLYDYAQKVFQEGVPEKAEEAYGHILARYPDFPGKDKALFGLAQSYEAEENFRKAVETYDRISQEFQNRPLAAQALFNKAMLLKDHLFDFTEAERTFQTLLKQYPSTREGQEGQLELVDCLISRGDLARAETIVRQALEHSSRNKESLWIRTLVRMADVLFLSERYDEVISQLDVLSNSVLGPDLLQDPALNDGLKLRFFVEEQARRSPEELHYYTRSELLKRQRRYNDALMVLDSLISQRPGTPLTPYGLFQKGQIGILQGNYRDSLVPFDSLQVLFPGSLLADQALERMGWIYERTGKKQMALNRYEKLLADYPQSLLADDIRARILRLEKEGS